MSDLEAIAEQAKARYTTWASLRVGDGAPVPADAFVAGYVAARALDIEPTEEGCVIRFTPDRGVARVRRVAIRHAGTTTPWSVSGTSGHRSWRELRSMMEDGHWERLVGSGGTDSVSSYLPSCNVCWSAGTTLLTFKGYQSSCKFHARHTSSAYVVSGVDSPGHHQFATSIDGEEHARWLARRHSIDVPGEPCRVVRNDGTLNELPVKIAVYVDGEEVDAL